MKNKVRPCPICKNLTTYSESNPYRPFCSERCQVIDLGEWASQKYAIPSKEEVFDVNENQGDDEGDSKLGR